MNICTTLLNDHPVFENWTLFPITSIVTKDICLVTLKVKYQNDPNKVKIATYLKS